MFSVVSFICWYNKVKIPFRSSRTIQFLVWFFIWLSQICFQKKRIQSSIEYIIKEDRSKDRRIIYKASKSIMTRIKNEIDLSLYRLRWWRWLRVKKMCPLCQTGSATKDWKSWRQECPRPSTITLVTMK